MSSAAEGVAVAGVVVATGVAVGMGATVAAEPCVLVPAAAGSVVAASVAVGVASPPPPHAANPTAINKDNKM